MTVNSLPTEGARGGAGRAPLPEGGRPGPPHWHGAWPLLATLLSLALVAGCVPRRELTPPEPSRKPSKAVARVLIPPEAAAAKRPAPMPPRLAPPRASSKEPRRQTYDPEQPCFTRGEMERAGKTLFRGRPAARRSQWLKGLNRAFFELEASCTEPGLLVTVLTIIQQESDVRVDPPLQNVDLENLLAFKLQRLGERNPLAAGLLDATGIEAALKARLREDARKVRLKTEGDLVRYVEEDLRGWFTGYLHREFSVPLPIAELAARIGISSPVNTIGPMQVNVNKAHRNALARGDGVDSAGDMRRLLLNPATALDRGLKEGIYLVWKTYRFYRERLPPERAAFFTGTDYNAGEFSSRNAAFQERVAALAGKPLALDGDLLLYRAGRPQPLISKTEAAVMTVLSDLTGAAIREDLRLEKQGGFTGSLTERRICERYSRKTGRPCEAARVPEGAVNETARVKLGRAYSPANYARAFRNRFRKNRKSYGEG